MEILINTIVFLTLGYASYYILSKIFAYQEGMTNGETKSDGDINFSTKAKAFAASIATETATRASLLKTGTYKDDYEDVISGVADLVEALMLETTLSIDIANPMIGIEKLVKLNQAKAALNTTFAYVKNAS
jgi:hypothetical protein